MRYLIILIVILSAVLPLLAQSEKDSIVLIDATLSDCLDYALDHQPDYQRILINEQVIERDIQVRLSDWLPQVNVDYNLQHYLKLPVSVFPDFENPESGQKRIVTIGLPNTSAVQLSANQTLFNNDVLFASQSARIFRLQAIQTTQAAKIDVIVDVTEAFYDALVTQQQLKVLEEDIQRLKQNLEDTYQQYQSGISDKIDYKRSTLALNNSEAERKNTEETILTKYAQLKQLMGYPAESPLSISYDSLMMTQEIKADTTEALQYERKIEYQLLKTQLELQDANQKYYKLGFLPSLSAFYNYNLVYQNEQFTDLYGQSYPNSLIGLRLSLPLFQGSKRIQNLRRANLEYKQVELDLENLRNQLQTAYTRSLGAYKSNLNELRLTEENIEIAKEIFKTVKLQYDEGVKTYLEVIVSETDLRTAQLNYLNTLLAVLTSKLELQKALGTLIDQTQN